MMKKRNKLFMIVISVAVFVLLASTMSYANYSKAANTGYNTYDVYFVDHQKTSLMEENRFLTSDYHNDIVAIANEVLNNMILGPNSLTNQAVVDPMTMVKDITLDGTVLNIDFTGNIFVDGVNENITLNALDTTLNKIEGVDKVNILIDNQLVSK